VFRLGDAPVPKVDFLHSLYAPIRFTKPDVTVVVNKDVAFPMRRRLELSDSSEPIYWDSKRPPLADSSFCNGLTIVPAWQPSPLHRPQLAC